MRLLIPLLVTASVLLAACDEEPPLVRVASGGFCTEELMSTDGERRVFYRLQLHSNNDREVEGPYPVRISGTCIAYEARQTSPEYVPSLHLISSGTYSGQQDGDAVSIDCTFDSGERFHFGGTHLTGVPPDSANVWETLRGTISGELPPFPGMPDLATGVVDLGHVGICE